MPQDGQSRYQLAIKALNEASMELRGVTLTPQQFDEVQAAANGVVHLAKSRVTR